MEGQAHYLGTRANQSIGMGLVDPTAAIANVSSVTQIARSVADGLSGRA